MLNEKSEMCFSDADFTAFMNLKDFDRLPKFHVAPSTIFAARAASHCGWESKPQRSNKARQDRSVRRSKDSANEYLDARALPGLEATL